MGFGTRAACRLLALAAVVTGAPAVASSVAATEAPAAAAEIEHETPSLLEGWTFTVAPYLWLPAIEGRVGAQGVSGRVDVSHGDVLDLIGDGLSLLAAFGRIEAQRGRFLAFVDTSLTRLDTDKGASLDDVDRGPISVENIDVDASLRLDTVFLEFGLGYRALEYRFLNRSRPFFADVFVGGRYYYFWTQGKVKATAKLLGLPSGPQVLRTAGRTTTTLDWVDPVVGFRWSIPVLEDLDVGFRGDVGGFEAGSDLAWSLTGTLRYHLPWRPCGVDPALVLGYRILDFDYESGGTTMDLSMSGPALGLTFHFPR